MAKIVLVTGGARSGKSVYAETRIQKEAGPAVYIATAAITDDEMSKRVEVHQQRREAYHWVVVEEQLDLPDALGRHQECPAVLVDCLTVWLGNLFWKEENERELSGWSLNEREVDRLVRAVIGAGQSRPGTVFFVTNEVGSGVVPDTSLGRRFRDLAGRCNRMMAEAADQVVLVTCGIPMILKGD